MDRLGHQQQARRDAAARFSQYSIVQTVGALGDAGARKPATARD
jgi:hypothetical protein